MLLIAVASGLPPTTQLWPSACISASMHIHISRYTYVHRDDGKLQKGKRRRRRRRSDGMAVCVCAVLWCVQSGEWLMRIHDKPDYIHTHTHRWEKGRCIYIYIREKSRYILCMCICPPGGLLIKTIRHRASSRTILLLCELWVELAPYRSFARSYWDAFSQLAAMYDGEERSERTSERERETQRKHA